MAEEARNVRSPHFFAFYSADLSSERLKIPERFMRHMEGRTSGLVSLFGPSGSEWSVELIQLNGGLFLHRGWPAFVRDHYVECGDFLIFRYDGDLCFTVLIFDQSACEKEAAFRFGYGQDSRNFEKYMYMGRKRRREEVASSGNKLVDGAVKKIRNGSSQFRSECIDEGREEATCSTEKNPLENPGKKTKKLKDNDMVHGLPYLDEYDKVCEGCQYGKQHREMFPSGQAQRAGAPLELVHVDLCGTMRIESTGGNKYFMLLVDDATRMKWVYFLRFKFEAFTCFQKFKAMTELQSGMKVKCVRSDRGGEFLSNEFKQYCDTEGIQRQLSLSYTPQQNGVVERKNRNVIEMAKSMLHDKGMPYYMWAEAVHTAVYLLNRCPTKSLDSITPFEAYSKRKPGIAHLKVFGSVCYVHTQSELRHKLEPKSIKGVFVGYAKCEKGYRVFDPISKRLILSRDVVFDENSAWDWERSTERYMSLPTYEFDTVDTPRSENNENDPQVSSASSTLK